MLTGHAYARALRGHFITSAALTRLMIDENPGCMIDINLEKLQHTVNLFLDTSCETEIVLREPVVTQITQILHDLASDLSLQSRTGKLWDNYLRQTYLLRLFIFAE